MVVRVFLCCLSLYLLNSCTGYKNEFGQKRFKYNRFTLKPNTNNDVYKIIDTTRLYKLIWSEDLKYNQTLEIANPTYLKFYENGKVGKFQNYDSKDVTSLNPQKARMAIYNYENNKLSVQVYFKHPQGGGLVRDDYSLRQRNDTLTVITEDNLEKYKILNLPKEFLIYKLDW